MSYAIMVGLSAFLVALFIGISRDFYRQKRTIKQLTSLKDQIAQLDKSNKELTDFLQYLESDAFVEAEAKTKMNLKKPGEKVVALQLNTSAVDNTVQQPMAQKKSVDTPHSPSNYVKLWWAYFFHRDISLSPQQHYDS